MDQKYLPTVSRRTQIVLEQIGECQNMIYRNNLENLTFIQKKDDDKQLEVQTNNKILSKKIDLLLTELDSLNHEASSNPTEPGTPLLSDAGGTTPGTPSI